MIIAMGSLGGGKGGFGGMFGGKGGTGGKSPFGPRAAVSQLTSRQMGGMGSDTKLMEEAFAWIEKNAGTGKYINVDKTRVAVAGQSCGGIEAYDLNNKARTHLLTRSGTMLPKTPW